jgi:hypothetical protein
MTKKDISEAKNPDLRGSQAAILRAAELARQKAIQTDTDLIVVQDGEIVRIHANELQKQNPSFGKANQYRHPKRCGRTLRKTYGKVR